MSEAGDNESDESALSSEHQHEQQETDSKRSAVGAAQATTAAAAAAPNESGDLQDEIARKRKAKRLIMNRESARERRKRKKLLVQTLEDQVAVLTKQNHQLKAGHETLQAQNRHLEQELLVARSAIGLLTNSQHQQQHNLSQAAALGALGNAAGDRLNIVSGPTQDDLRRLLRAQSMSLPQAAGAAASAGLSVARPAMAEDAQQLYRAAGQRHADLDLASFGDVQQALSQAVSGRDAVLDLSGRIQGIDSLPVAAAAAAAAGVSPQSLQGTQARTLATQLSAGGGLTDAILRSAAIRDDQHQRQSSQTASLLDVLTPSATAETATARREQQQQQQEAATAQMLEEVLKQRGAKFQ